LSGFCAALDEPDPFIQSKLQNVQDFMKNPGRGHLAAEGHILWPVLATLDMCSGNINAK
jgi:hypothetical protein